MFDNIEEILNDTGVVITGFSGNSMYPMLRSDKDKVVIEKLNRRLNVNDIPLYRNSNNKLVLHRIVRITSDSYIIRGDNLYNNEIVKIDNIIGVLKSFYREEKLIDCNNILYKIYIFYIRISYPLRLCFSRYICRILSKFKRKIITKNCNK